MTDLETTKPVPSVPAFCGSPAMRVLAFIPTDHGRLVGIAVVAQERADGSTRAYGTVEAYRHSMTSRTWHANAGHYDFATRTAALLNMIERARITEH